jgi:hypothetical protein
LSSELQSLKEFDTLGNIEDSLKNAITSLNSLSSAFSTNGEINVT